MKCMKFFRKHPGNFSVAKNELEKKGFREIENTYKGVKRDAIMKKNDVIVVLEAYRNICRLKSKLKYSCCYKADCINPMVRHGKSISYHRNGNKHVVTNWKNGKRWGLQEYYREDGTLQSKCIMQSRQKVCEIEYCADGVTILHNYRTLNSIIEDDFNKKLEALNRIETLEDTINITKVFNCKSNF